MHRLSTLVTILALSVGLASAQTQWTESTAVYDKKYDDLRTPTADLTCGSKLSTRYPYLDSFPQVPNTYVGGSDIVSDSDKSKCGACYVVYNEGDTSKYIYFVPVDTSQKGFALSDRAFYTLTGQSPGDANGVSVVVSYQPVAPRYCGF